MNNNDLSLFPELTRSKMLTVNFGTNSPTINKKYFFDYDLELRESKTVGVFWNPFFTNLIYKFQNFICLTTNDALNSCYVNLVDKDNNVVVHDMPLNALFRPFYSKGSNAEISLNNGFFIKKFNVEIDWAKSYVIFYANPGALSGQLVPLTIYYKRKIQK